MPEFLAENNLCGQTILQLVSRGNAILAELLRLKDYIPKVYKLATKDEIQKYGEIVMDFSYFKVAEAQEEKIEHNEHLQDLDEEFRDNHLEMITRFYVLFESIHIFVIDLNHFLEELDEGLYIHQTLETVFADVEGKQLLCESLYLYGLMLLLVDYYIEGPVRERILVSYYRYTPQKRDTASGIEEVCKLLRDTGLTTAKRPINYPEDYFKRIPMKFSFVDIVIGRLRSDDIYDQLAVYPMPSHRSTALATQASMLYVCLFFSPEILHLNTAIMREIVDKYFPDNWVISIYMGHTVNLVESWDMFKAAKQALNNTLERSTIKSYCGSYGNGIPELLKASSSLLKEGAITKDSLLKDINKIINIIRSCNVVLRWMMLHTTLKPGKQDVNKRCKSLREIVITETKHDPVSLFKLLLNTAQLELCVRELYKGLLAAKESKWEELKKESHSSLVELSEVFSGLKPLTRIQKNENLQKWFLEISKQVNLLEKDNSASSRKIVQLIQALEEVQEFHQLESNMQVIQFLSETRKHLDQMIRNMNIKEDVLITMQIIGDVSYAWELVDSFTSIMQVGIKREPTVVKKLRAVFLKLASALEIPLLRINQAHSDDLLSVSQYYSSELEIYVRKVLQVIPKTMFEKMARIIQMQTSVLKELPTRLDKDKMKEHAQLNERFEFAELTHSVSVFSEGMRMMKTTLVGVVCLDPRKLLEDGIRKELVQHISKALHELLMFSARTKPDELGDKLKALGQIMNGHKRSFEYIQDYVNINSLKIWQEEVTRIINFNVEQECNAFLRRKVYSWQSSYQSRHVPIPHYPAIDISENFIGRLAREVIRVTDPRATVFIRQMSTWYDIKTNKAVFNKDNISSIASAIEITGLVGLDRLFSFMIVTNLKKISSFLENGEQKNSVKYNIVCSVVNEMKTAQFPLANAAKFYQNLVNRTTKIWAEFLDSILIVGQLQLLRHLIAFHLNLSCRFNAKHLESSLATLNKALLADVMKDRELPGKDLLYELSQYFDYTGMNDPFHKVYITSYSGNDFCIILFVFVISHIQRLFFLRNSGAVKRVDQIDGATCTAGVHTVFKQFHINLNKSFIKRLVQYCTEITKYNAVNTKGTELLSEVAAVIKFLDVYSTYLKESHDFFTEALPEEIFHMYQTLAVVN